MKRIVSVFLTLICVLGVMLAFVGCEERQSDVVSYNLSLEADSFNVTRRITVINLRTDTVLFQMIGNFSIETESDGDLTVTGEDSDGTYYKHFVKLAPELTCITEQLETNTINKHKYTINFNPEMILPIEIKTVD